MSKDIVYTALETRMLGYEDLISVPVVDNGEPLVPLQPTPFLAINVERTEMLPFTGESIYVRQAVAQKLGAVSVAVARALAGAQLDVGYGYRALSVQRANFNTERERLRSTVAPEQLDEAAHRYIAIPEIAGHPTGGAVDLQITQCGRPLDFGTRIWEFAKDSYTNSPYVSVRAANNRALLRGLMTAAGFAAFEGEWWHFSYGDKEWAALTGSPNALYDQVEFSV